MEIINIIFLIIAICVGLLSITYTILLIPSIVESYRETFNSDRK